jgi:hypothetical protein
VSTSERPGWINAMVNAPRGGRAIAELLDDAHLQFVSEDDLQQSIKEHLDEFDIYPEREVRLSDGRSRIDLMAGGIGIEVKLDGSWANVTRQLMRYAKCDEILALVLVTTRAKHHRIPEQLAGKPIHLVSLIGAGL